MVLSCESRKLGLGFALNLIEHPSLRNRGCVDDAYSNRGIEQGRETLGLGGVQIGLYSVLELAKL